MPFLKLLASDSGQGLREARGYKTPSCLLLSFGRSHEKHGLGQALFLMSPPTLPGPSPHILGSPCPSALGLPAASAGNAIQHPRAFLPRCPPLMGAETCGLCLVGGRGPPSSLQSSYRDLGSGPCPTSPAAPDASPCSWHPLTHHQLCSLQNRRPTGQSGSGDRLGSMKLPSRSCPLRRGTGSPVPSSPLGYGVPRQAPEGTLVCKPCFKTFSHSQLVRQGNSAGLEREMV